MPRGGLAVALAEMAMASGIGATVGEPEGGAPLAAFFGEDQARYLVACTAGNAAKLAEAAAAAGVPLATAGSFGGETVVLGGDAAALAELSQLYRTAFEKSLNLELA